MIKLSQHNAELIDLNDRALMEALLDKWGHTYKTISWGSGFKFTEIDGVQYYNAAAGKNRMIEIINEHSDENGVVIL